MRYTYEEPELVRKDNGKRLYFSKCSCPASDPERNILLVHGLTSSCHVYDIDYKDYSVTKFFARNGYNVWRFEIGGYGRSDKYEDGFDVDSDNVAKDIICALEKINELMGVTSSDVFGWSWGSITSSRADIARPDLIRRLVWVGPCFGGTIPKTLVSEPFTTLDYPYCTRVFQHVPGSSLDIDYEVCERPVVGIWLDGEFKYDLDHGRPNGGNRDILEAGDDWLIDVKSLSAPACYLAGTNDAYLKPDRAKAALDVLPAGSEYHLFRGAGHALWAEKDYYRPVREAALAFLEKEI